jgi:hypothetical protein
MINDLINGVTRISKHCCFCGKRKNTIYGEMAVNSHYESDLAKYYHPKCLYDLLANPESNPKKVDIAISLADFADAHKNDITEAMKIQSEKFEKAKIKSRKVKSIFADEILKDKFDTLSL